MKLDKAAVRELLSLDDARFSQVILSMAREAGLDPAHISLTPANLSAIRYALSMATDEDLAKAAKRLGISQDRGG